MAEFLVTSGNSHYIEQIAREAQEKLVLVTPYLKLNPNFQKRLIDADKRGVEITIVYGKNQLSDLEKKKLQDLVHLQIFYCENLHAKCYHNESSMVISSMNLYEFSEKNNREMGLYFTKQRDSRIFNEALKEINSIIDSSELLRDQTYIKNPDYSGQDNFHLPTLYNQFKAEFGEWNWQLSQSRLIADDFPVQGISVAVSHRILFSLGSSKKVKACEGRLKLIEKIIPHRLFINYDSVAIYPPEGFNPICTKDGLKEKADYFIEVFRAYAKKSNFI